MIQAMPCHNAYIHALKQVLKEMALHSASDSRCVDLLFANQGTEDYLCQVLDGAVSSFVHWSFVNWTFCELAQSDLMSLKAIMKERLNIYDFFERAKHSQYLLPNSWNTNLPQSGRIDVDSMRRLLPPPNDETLIMLCGTPGMKDLMYGKKSSGGGRDFDGDLATMGYSRDMVHLF